MQTSNRMITMPVRARELFSCPRPMRCGACCISQQRERVVCMAGIRCFFSSFFTAIVKVYTTVCGSSRRCHDCFARAAHLRGAINFYGLHSEQYVNAHARTHARTYKRARTRAFGSRRGGLVLSIQAYILLSLCVGLSSGNCDLLL